MSHESKQSILTTGFLQAGNRLVTLGYGVASQGIQPSLLTSTFGWFWPTAVLDMYTGIDTTYVCKDPSSGTERLKNSCYANAQITCMSRSLDWNGVLLELANIASIAYEVWIDNTLSSSGSIPLSAFSDTPWDTPLWNRDSVGPTLMYDIPGSAFPDTNTEYTIVIQVTEHSGVKYPVFWGYAYAVTI